jgi:hypothetical protein
MFHCRQRTSAGIVSTALGEPSRQAHHEAQAILQVVELRLSHHPVPVEVRVMEDHPWKRLDQACLEIVLGQSSQQDLARVLWLPGTRTQIGEPGIAQPGEISRQPGRRGSVGCRRA